MDFTKHGGCAFLTYIYCWKLFIIFVTFSVLPTDSQNGFKHLSYDNIYNSTSYPQLQYTPRVYNFEQKYNKQVNDMKYSDDYNNDLEYSDGTRDRNKNKNNMLLVGFTHDPYGNSILEEDFVKIPSMFRYEMMSASEGRGKRGVLHLYNMIACATGCDPLSYKGYGCYCGFQGSGRSMDGIDRCCKIHDHCYAKISCLFYTVYFQPYYWLCRNHEPLCALENHEASSRGLLVGACAGKLCECDRELAMCLRRYQCPRRRALCHSYPLRLFQNLLLGR